MIYIDLRGLEALGLYDIVQKQIYKSTGTYSLGQGNQIYLLVLITLA